MVGNIRRIGVLVALSLVLLLGVGLVAISYCEVGVASEVGERGLPLSWYDPSTIPEEVAEDATELAAELFGDYREKYEDFLNQLLAAYVAAKDKDFVVIFNPGGWGWHLPENSPGWSGILNGIKSELASLGYTSVLLDYRRTADNLRGVIREFVEIITFYPAKARNLAYRVEFLTDHIPRLKVIVTGGSSGTVISDRVMDLLRDNPQVYSIQVGPPFWHKPVVPERTLILDNNGVIPDTFSHGDIPAMLWATLKDFLGLPSAKKDQGRILYFLRAPGHDYRWQYFNVYYQITKFLEENFGANNKGGGKWVR
jgi:hypothetical protein